MINEIWMTGYWLDVDKGLFDVKGYSLTKEEAEAACETEHDFVCRFHSGLNNSAEPLEGHYPLKGQ